jgi:hypothetical protein
MDKKQEKSVIVFLVILILIISFSIGYVVFSRTTTIYQHNGPGGTFNFTLDKHTGDEIHILEVYKQVDTVFWQRYLIPFNYGPADLEGISIEDSRYLITDSEKIYITRDVYLDLKTNNELIVAMLTVDRVVGQDMLDPPVYNIPTLLASIEDNDRTQELDLPILTCENANEARTVIWFKEGSENRIYKGNDYCVIAEYVEGEDPVKIGTALTYHIIGVM